MCFDIGSQHLGCWGQNTSRIQNKEVYATLCLQVGNFISKVQDDSPAVGPVFFCLLWVFYFVKCWLGFLPQFCEMLDLSFCPICFLFVLYGDVLT